MPEELGKTWTPANGIAADGNMTTFILSSQKAAKFFFFITLVQFWESYLQYSESHSVLTGSKLLAVWLTTPSQCGTHRRDKQR